MRPPLLAKLEMATYFLPAEGPLKKVCHKKHKPGSVCVRPHAVPPHAIWSGQWPVGHKGDLTEAIKVQRKKYRRAMRRWREDLARLLAVKPARTFAAYLKTLINSHKKTQPNFTFQPPEAPKD